MPNRIVIAGAGFAGIYTLLKLIPHIKNDDLKVTLIDKNNYFLFTPMLHEVAAGGLNPKNLMLPIRSVINSSVSFVQAEIKQINLEKNEIGLDNETITYDQLLLATGSTTNFYNITGANEYTFKLKSIADASNIHKNIIASLEQAIHIKNNDEKKIFSTFIIVGGGPTGVELAAEIVELAGQFIRNTVNQTLEEFGFKIYILNSNTKLLGSFDNKLSNQAQSILEKQGIKILNCTKVIAVQKDRVLLENEMELKSNTIIWTAGVKANIPEIFPRLELDYSERIITDEYFRIPKFNNVFVAGDAVSYTDDNQKIMPMLAQAAVYQSANVARNILNQINKNELQKIKPFEPDGILVSLGQWKAIGIIKNIRVSGPLAWWIWRTVYLMKYTSWKKRFFIAIDWTVNLFLPRDVSSH